MEKEHIKQQIKGFLDTPPIWLNSQFGIQQFDFPQVDVSDFSPMAIPQKLRLGHQIEQVFKQLLDHGAQYEILVYNLPIRRNKQTLGEIDFIVQHKDTQALIHIELTYKFYIIDTQISDPIHQLIGPNRRDMFFTKMEKIKNAQFSLLHTPEAAIALRVLDIDHQKIEHQTCYKAQLFEPYGSEALEIAPPLNPNCIVGSWLRMVDFLTEAFKGYEFYIPYKSQWVMQPHDAVEWTSHYETILELNMRLIKQNAPMVWMKKSETEFEKFFVVWW